MAQMQKVANQTQQEFVLKIAIVLALMPLGIWEQDFFFHNLE